MSSHVKIFFGILLIGSVLILGYRAALPWLQANLQKQTSDAAATKGTLRIGVDSWIGYYPLCSDEMRRRLRADGYALRCEDDGGDYPGRLKKLADGELDLAVATVDAYLLNGAALDYPAAIIAVIDESNGGDAIVARRSVVPNLDALKRTPVPKIAFTPASPSEHLLKSIATHFDLPAIQDRRGSWRVETAGSGEALKQLQEAKVDVAVLWQPDVASALRDTGLHKLIGTDDTDKLIVDVLLASRGVLREQPDALRVLLQHYFDTLRYYGEQAATLRTEVMAARKLDAAQTEQVLDGVAWASLSDNGSTWFGITPTGVRGNEGLIRSIDSTLSVLRAAGDFSTNPLPDADPYRVLNSTFVAELYRSARGIQAGAQAGDEFAALDEAGWARLKEVGTLKLESIGFARGTAALDESSRSALDAIAERLAHYPNYRLLIKGHTGVTGDPKANLELSRLRAEAVAGWLIEQKGVDPDRLRGLGFGGSQPLPRLSEESDRAWGYRLPRVELALVSESF